MSIHEHLPPQARKELKWTKGLELAKVPSEDGTEFDCATWLNKARLDQAGGGEGTDGTGIRNRGRLTGKAS